MTADRRDPSEPARPDPGDVAGRPEAMAPKGEAAVYGEPKGPRPPRLERRPKAEIEARAAAGVEPASPSRTAPDGERDGFVGGGGEPAEAGPDEPSKVMRRPVDGPGGEDGS